MTGTCIDASSPPFILSLSWFSVALSLSQRGIQSQKTYSPNGILQETS